jgi:hypothetical protein
MTRALAFAALAILLGCGGSSSSKCTDKSCGTDHFCDEPKGVCVANGTAIAGAYCNDDRDCAGGLACNASSATCATPMTPGSVNVGGACVVDSDCMVGAACANALCIIDSYSPGAQSSGAPCYQDVDCASAYCNLVSQTCV